MKNLTFALWTCLWPVAYKFALYLESLTPAVVHKKYSEVAELTVSILFMGTWIGVAYLLYERDRRPAEPSVP